MTTKQLVFVDVTNHEESVEARPTSVQGTFERFHAEGIQMETNGCIRVATSGSGDMVLDVYGHVLADKIRARSDERLKTNITSLQSGLDIIKKLSGKVYQLKDEKRLSYGLVAQDVEKVIPDLVVSDPRDEYKTVSYLELIPFIIEAIKEIDDKLDNVTRLLA
jgi:hypothetical protein